MGPNSEGKVHTVFFDNNFSGSVIGKVDVYIGLPGLVAASAAEAGPSSTEPSSTVQYASIVATQPARADGSIVHVVQPGDTVSAISVAYRVGRGIIIRLNQLPDNGNTILVGQELLSATWNDQAFVDLID